METLEYFLQKFYSIFEKRKLFFWFTRFLLLLYEVCILSALFYLHTYIFLVKESFCSSKRKGLELFVKGDLENPLKEEINKTSTGRNLWQLHIFPLLLANCTQPELSKKIPKLIFEFFILPFAYLFHASHIHSCFLALGQIALLI